MTTIEINELLTIIGSGGFDDRLDAIVGAVNDRRKAAGRRSFLTCKVGDTGRLVDTIRPRYLAGAPFTVITKRQTKIGVRIDQEFLDANPQARARWSGTVICPPELLDFG